MTDSDDNGDAVIYFNRLQLGCRKNNSIFVIKIILYMHDYLFDDINYQYYQYTYIHVGG
jgi:hypothetical protein